MSLDWGLSIHSDAVLPSTVVLQLFHTRTLGIGKPKVVAKASISVPMEYFNADLGGCLLCVFINYD
jgi:hypothetical protein